MAIATQEPIMRLVWPHSGNEIDLAPIQGLWSEAQYLALTDSSRVLIEFTDGVIEVLPMPTDNHQVLLLFLYNLLNALLQPLGGKVLVAPLRMQVRPGKYREPDILLVRAADDPRRQNRYWLGADLVMEVVSPDNPERDITEKPLDYAEVGIPEYWIINPLDETITVLTLEGAAYVEHGVFRRGQRATSRLLAGFAVAADELFDAK